MPSIKDSNKTFQGRGQQGRVKRIDY
uniref:Uncharacterized protein n=1 Tax=Arundo donax TaxID=35708 RepID=A0A0A8YI11_ARUDO